MIRTGFSSKTGQALVFAIFLLALAGMLASAVAGIWGNALRLRSLETRSLIAFYLAQAGIERAKIEAKIGAVTAPGWSSAQILGGGTYSYYIEDIGSNQRVLRSIGKCLDSSGNTVATRMIEVKAQNISSPPESQIAWSWQEI